MPILAVCPSRNRPQAARETLASFLATRKDPNSRLVFLVDRDDATRADYPAEYTHLIEPQGTMGGALHVGLPEVIGDATSVGMVGDDNRFASKGWDVTLDKWLTENVGIAYGDDGFQHERLPTSWWLSRKIADRLGLAPKGLKHFYMDNYWRDLGQDAKCLRYFPDVLIEHLHPLAGKAEPDAIFARNHRHAAHDKLWYSRWQRHDRQREAAVVRSLANAGQPRRILADWHHPALWESLSILFEDRFGWELYSPTGVEWKRHGYKFEHNGTPSDWYLTQPAKAVDDHFEITSAEYPARKRKAVTFAQADAMRWDFVLASVVVHQRAFSDLAKRWGGRFIHQVGNTHHYIDRTVPQIVLASAKVRQRHAVIYHQEFDRDLFAFRPSQHTGTVGSFMLRSETAGCDHRWLSDAIGDCWHEYGREIDDPHYLAPMTKVAQTMAACDWIWHDKKIGDGYGHVLHNAAALGRPLIGHGSHYKRLLGEPFWQDTKTCIDLDKHNPKEALRLVRAISAAPEWHDELSGNIAEVFSKTVDFDGEARAIAEALA